MSQYNEIKGDEQQVLYASILEKGMLMGLVLLLITFAIYLLGILEPAVPLNKIASFWKMDVDSYLKTINEQFLKMEHAPTGWAWLSLLHKGDFVNFSGVAMLSGVTIICYISIVPGLFRKGDIAYAVMAIAEVVILTLAASGLLTVGH
jgi:hypothetical protein